MTSQVTKESNKCEQMSLRYSLEMMKVLTEDDNNIRTTMNIKGKPCLWDSFEYTIPISDYKFLKFTELN